MLVLKYILNISTDTTNMIHLKNHLRIMSPYILSYLVKELVQPNNLLYIMKKSLERKLRRKWDENCNTTQNDAFKFSILER